MRRVLSLVVLYLALTSWGCGSDNGSPTAPTPPPAPAQVSLTGTVSAQGGARLGGATVTITDGQNVNRTVTANGNGEYRFDNLIAGNANLVARASGYDEARGGLAIDGVRTLNFTLRTAVPWSRTGSGNTVFDMPTYITRVRVTGTFTGFSSNFIIRVGGRLLVNELLGTGWGSTRYEGVHLTTGGVVEIVDSTGVSWTLVEER